MDFSKFNKAVNLDGLKNDIKDAENGNGTFEEVPVGTYEVKITKLELAESKAGDPMFSCCFQIVGDYQKRRLIFMNQVITKGFQIHIVNEFLRSLDSGLDVHFDDFEQYGNLIYDIKEKIEGEHLEFALEYGKKNNFPTFKITEVFEGEAIPF